jgi:hypothetical protein
MNELMWTSLLYIILSGLLCFWASRTRSLYLNVLSAAAVTFLGIYWLINYRDVTGIAISIIIFAVVAYIGYQIAEIIKARLGG